MDQCKICESHAINPHCYGRDPNEDLDLCDVCYWRKRAEAFQWRPIETAPRDGTRILLYRPTAGEWGQFVFGKYENDEYAKKPKPHFRTDLERLWGVRSDRESQPTHWMPLPEPPKAEGSK